MISSNLFRERVFMHFSAVEEQNSFEIMIFLLTERAFMFFQQWEDEIDWFPRSGISRPTLNESPAGGGECVEKA